MTRSCASIQIKQLQQACLWTTNFENLRVNGDVGKQFFAEVSSFVWFLLLLARFALMMWTKKKRSIWTRPCHASRWPSPASSTTFNGPDGFLFFPSWLYFNAYMHLFQKHKEHKLRWAQGSFLQVIQNLKYVDAIGRRRFSEGTSADHKIQQTLMEVGVYSFFLIHIMILWWGWYISYVGKIKKKLCHL